MGPAQVPKEIQSQQVLPAKGVLIPGLPPLLDPDPWALLFWDWRAGCAPGRGRGAQAGPGCDSFLPTQPSPKWGGWPAGARAQPLSSCRNPARWPQFAEATEARPWQDSRPCLSDHQQAHPVGVHCHDESRPSGSGHTRHLAHPYPLPTHSPPIITSPGTPPPPAPHRVPPSPLTWRVKEFGLCSQKTTPPSQLPGVGLQQAA